MEKRTILLDQGNENASLQAKSKGLEKIMRVVFDGNIQWPRRSSESFIIQVLADRLSFTSHPIKKVWGKSQEMGYNELNFV